MALAGLKKQINKANQYMSERFGVEGTKYTDEYTNLERRTDLTCELVDELINKTKEYLQPNPASRTKLMVSSKLKGAPGKPHSYPQPEGLLGETMCKFGKELYEDSNFAKSLIEMGEALKEMSEIKYALEDNVKQNFLEPLTHLQMKDLKDVLFHRRKLEGRRLDFDCKKRKKQKGTHFTDDDIKMAEDKFEESFNLASMGMHNLLQNEIEQLSEICVLSEALYEYHSQCANILESLNARLMEIKNEAAQRSFQPYVPKKLHELNLISNIQDDLSPGEAMGNGAKFYSDNSSNGSHRSNTLTNTTQPFKPPISRKPNNLPSSTSSSPLSIKSGRWNGHHRNNGFDDFSSHSSSTTDYLLSGKGQTTNNHQQSNQFSHSKSLLNVSNFSSDWDTVPATTTSNFTSSNNDAFSSNRSNNRSSNYDLLSGLNFDQNQSNYNSESKFYSASSSYSNNNTQQRSSWNDWNSSRTPTDRGPCCQAVYDFDAENENELSLKEGEIIQLISKIDDNWYEGTVNGKTGLFPVSYVQVVVPLPK